jgi:hypothetical protein
MEDQRTLWVVEEWDPEFRTWVALPVFAFNRRAGMEKLAETRQDPWSKRRRYKHRLTKYVPS